MYIYMGKHIYLLHDEPVIGVLWWDSLRNWLIVFVPEGSRTPLE